MNNRKNRRPPALTSDDVVAALGVLIPCSLFVCLAWLYRGFEPLGVFVLGFLFLIFVAAMFALWLVRTLDRH